MSIRERIKAIHRWLQAHKAYWLAPLIAFPEAWAQMPELQQHLPPVLVSHLAALAFSVRLATLIAASRKAGGTPDKPTTPEDVQ